MSKTIIKVDNLSKRYRLGVIGGKTLHEDVQRWIAKLRGKPDPLIKIGQEVNGNISGENLWALRGVNFEVNQGDILGIIGRNGAGKSTLLKIISQITAPTSGEIKIQGRVGSLLEVGTGFHPELTGRENTYLNGAILGMSKQEVDRKFDEIVSFAEIDKFVDTPVKRYSSGMYVRLAFAVAAHLDPEILVVDEVLAVGDAKFQKKCLGKMKDVSGEGRTVLFVSHNMLAVQSMCNRAIILSSGKMLEEGEPDVVVSKYLSIEKQDIIERNEETLNDNLKNDFIRMHRASIRPKGGKVGDPMTIRTPLLMEFQFTVLVPEIFLDINISVSTEQNVRAFVGGAYLSQDEKNQVIPTKKGRYRCRCIVPGDILNSGAYYVRFHFGKDSRYVVYAFDDLFSFEILDDVELRGEASHHRLPGVCRPLLEWAVCSD